MSPHAWLRRPLKGVGEAMDTERDASGSNGDTSPGDAVPLPTIWAQRLFSVVQLGQAPQGSSEQGVLCRSGSGGGPLVRGWTEPPGNASPSRFSPSSRSSWHPLSCLQRAGPGPPLTGPPGVKAGRLRKAQRGGNTGRVRCSSTVSCSIKNTRETAFKVSEP